MLVRVLIGTLVVVAFLAVPAAIISLLATLHLVIEVPSGDASLASRLFVCFAGVAFVAYESALAIAKRAFLPPNK